MKATCMPLAHSTLFVHDMAMPKTSKNLLCHMLPPTLWLVLMHSQFKSRYSLTPESIKVEVQTDEHMNHQIAE